MSLLHTLEDSVFCDIESNLRTIKAISGTLMSAAVSGDELEPEEVGTLALLIYDAAQGIIKFLEESEGGGLKASAPDGRLDPIAADNLRKDLDGLEAASRSIIGHLEGICHDFGMELSPGLKAKIASEGEAA